VKYSSTATSNTHRENEVQVQQQKRVDCRLNMLVIFSSVAVAPWMFCLWEGSFCYYSEAEQRKKQAKCT